MAERCVKGVKCEAMRGRDFMEGGGMRVRIWSKNTFSGPLGESCEPKFKMMKIVRKLGGVRVKWSRWGNAGRHPLSSWSTLGLVGACRAARSWWADVTKV